MIGWRQDEEALRGTVVAAVKRGAHVVAVQGDVSDPATSALLAKTALAEFGGVDVWVNNAGVSVLAPVLETTPAQMSHMLGVNYLGTFYGLQAAARAMGHAGRPGRIVNVASDLGLLAAPMLAGYSATKFAVIGLTQAAAVELAPLGVTVNAVCPGTVETDMVLAEQTAEAHWQGTSVEEVRQRLVDAVPAGRLCTPGDVGSLVAWLVQPRGRLRHRPGHLHERRVHIALSPAGPLDRSTPKGTKMTFRPSKTKISTRASATLATTALLSISISYSASLPASASSGLAARGSLRGRVAHLEPCFRRRHASPRPRHLL